MEEYGKAEFIKCSTCKKKYINDDEHIKSDFGFNRMNKQYKCCVKCRAYAHRHFQTTETKHKRTEYNSQEVICDNCGCAQHKGSLSVHKRRYGCQTHHLKNKPDFEDWLMEQDYDKLLWEYK